MLNLNEYLAQISSLKELDDHCLFRGQANADWLLESGARRRLKSTTPSDNNDVYTSVYLSYHRQLIESARRLTTFSGNEPNTSSDMQILANLQHLGAGTGLLDFTWNSLFALWFAIAETKHLDCDGKVFFISDSSFGTGIITPRYEELPSDEILCVRETDPADLEAQSPTDTRIYEISRFRYLIWEPPVIGDAGARIFGQRSVFLIGRTNIDESDLKSIQIPAKSKRSLLSELEEMDVTENTIFRDLVGFAKAEGPNVAYRPARKAKHYLKRGIEEYRNKQPQYAIASYTDCIAMSNLSRSLLEALFYRAHICSELGDRENTFYDQANGDYSKVLEILNNEEKEYILADEKESFRLRCIFNRANVRSYIEILDEAIDDYQSIDTRVARDTLTHLYYNWGNALFRFGIFAQAAEKYELQLTKTAAHGDTLSNLALTNIVLGNWPRAERLYTEAQSRGKRVDDNLESIEKLKEIMGATFDDGRLQRQTEIYSDSITIFPFSHAEYSEEPAFVGFSGLAGNVGNVGWGEVGGGSGFPGDRGLLVSLSNS